MAEVDSVHVEIRVVMYSGAVPVCRYGEEFAQDAPHSPDHRVAMAEANKAIRSFRADVEHLLELGSLPNHPPH